MPAGNILIIALYFIEKNEEKSICTSKYPHLSPSNHIAASKEWYCQSLSEM